MTAPKPRPSPSGTAHPSAARASVNFLNGGALTAHNTQTVTYSLTLNAVVGSNPLFIRRWDAPLTFSGAGLFGLSTLRRRRA